MRTPWAIVWELPGRRAKSTARPGRTAADASGVPSGPPKAMPRRSGKVSAKETYRTGCMWAVAGPATSVQVPSGSGVAHGEGSPAASPGAEIRESGLWQEPSLRGVVGERRGGGGEGSGPRRAAAGPLGGAGSAPGRARRWAVWRQGGSRACGRPPGASAEALPPLLPRGGSAAQPGARADARPGPPGFSAKVGTECRRSRRRCSTRGLFRGSGRAGAGRGFSDRAKRQKRGAGFCE